MVVVLVVDVVVRVVVVVVVTVVMVVVAVVVLVVSVLVVVELLHTPHFAGQLRRTLAPVIPVSWHNTPGTGVHDRWS